MRSCLLTICLLALVGRASAQDVPPRVVDEHRVMLTPEAGPHFPLRPFPIPRTVRVEANGVRVDTVHFSLDAGRSLLFVEPTVLDTTRDLIVAYRTIPLRAGPSFTLVDTTQGIELGAEAGRPGVRAADGVPGDPFAGVQLARRGSVTRGITTGSNRDVGVESGLRLELSGEVAEGVSIRAMLSDENTPILPEGTTRRIEEFDRVFIEIESPVGTARLGDIDYRLDRSTFATITRKLQGAAVESRVAGAAGPLARVEARAAGATSRGQFRSQTLSLEDGVQGPYRLRGAQGEPFVLVIPGSERIYWDGALLERGENSDYVLDYATGELSFTTNRIVTAERRVLAEFEYSTNQFTRTFVAAQAEVQFWQHADGPRGRLGGAFLREADGSRFLDEFGMTSDDSLRLAMAGDAPAFRSGAEQVVFDPEAPYVQYVRRDTVITGSEFSEYFRPVARQPAAGEAVYRVRFSLVGPGSGSYQRTGQSINGIVYEFRGPGQGSYEPVRLLPAPVEKQVVDIYGSALLLPRVELFGEWARSLHDANRLSLLDKSDDQGSAYELGLRLQPVPLVGEVMLGGQVRRRRVDDSFSPFDRIRPIEFGRHWNIERGSTRADVQLPGMEEMDEAQLQLSKEAVGEIRGEAGRLRVGEWFEGERIGLFAGLHAAGWPVIRYRGEQVESVDRIQNEAGTWNRHEGIVQIPLRPWNITPAIQVEHEDRRQRALVSDSLVPSSLRFTRVTPGLAWQSDRITGTADVTFRTDDQWIDGRMAHAFDSWIASSGLEYAGQAFTGNLRVSYRERRYSELFRSMEGRADEASLLVRSGFRWTPHPRAVEVTTSYEATSERTPLLQEIFVRTGPELGQYVWEDLNGDGIVQVEELIPERTPNEGVYAKTFLPSDSLISTISVQARGELRLDGSVAWDSPRSWQALLSRVSSRTVVEVVETTRDDDLARIYLLYLTRFRNPSTTVNGRFRVGQTITLFPRSRRVGIDLGHSQVRSLSSRAGGGESRFFATWSAESRWLVADPVTLRIVAARERNRQESEQFATRRFDITAHRLDPEVILRMTDRIRVSTPTAFAWKQDPASARRATIARLPAEFQYQIPGRMSWTSRIEMAHVTLSGESRGLAEYELTDGRGPGTSFLWTTSARYNINEYLRATLQYDGRAPEAAPVVHALRMQLSAVF